MLKNKKFVLCIILVVLFLSVSGESRAALQSNPSTYYTKGDGANNWVGNIRSMETTGQAMGLNETINGTTLAPTSASNGIDVHMMKTTEYGAIAILSASGYGNPQTIQTSAVRTTTGNKTGIYYSLGNWEFSAGGLQGYAFPGIDARYYNTYTTSISSARVGDSLGNASVANPGCYGWHSAPYAIWLASNYYYVHSPGSIFTYSYANYTDGYFARGVAVCGSGL